jgi:hypothetical protein
VVQVAQVFIVDQELRRHLEAEVRNQIKGQSDRSGLQMREDLQRAQAASDRRLQQEGLETERERLTIARATLQLQNEFEREAIESKTPIRLLDIEAQHDISQAELALAQLTNALRTLEVEREMVLAQAQQQLRKDILPLEQIPLIAEAAAKVWQGANLSIYGETAPIVATIGPLVEVLTQALQLSAASRVPESHHN